MPTRRCCCGPCYSYDEDFVRYDEFDAITSDASYLEPDWEVCGSWSDWQLNYLGPSNGQLENTVAGAKVVLKHMVGNPYGILRVHIQITAGAIYRVHVFHGTEELPCTGETIIVEVECTGSDEGVLRLINSSDSSVISDVEFSGIADDDLHVCVGDRIIEATLTSTSDTLRHCGTVSGYWFALEGVTDGAEATQWSDLRYEDHWEHDKRCLRCSRHCCFPLFNKVISGFWVTITGITAGTSGDCECEETIAEFFLEVAPDTDLCECYTEYSINGAFETMSGPHGCGSVLSEDESQPLIVMDCDNENRLISWEFSMYILDLGDTEIHANTTFDPDTDPEDIRATGLTFYDTGDGASCNYESATISFRPELVDDCCSEALVVGATAVTATAKVTELPYAEHEALIAKLRELRAESDKGLGDTALRIVRDKSQSDLWQDIRRWLKFYSCSRSQAARLINRLFPN